MRKLRLLSLLLLAFTFTQVTFAQERRGDRTLTIQPVARETTAGIIAREKTTRTWPRVDHELEYPDRSRLPQNPMAESVSSFPDDESGNRDVKTPLAPAPQTVDLNFNGVTGPTETGAFPPDNMGTVGPTQYVLFVNGRIRSFNKTTGAADGVLNIDPDVFFASVMTPVSGPVVANYTSDPRIRYDRFSGKWILLIIDVPCTNATCSATAPNRILIAYSDGPVLSGSTVWTFTQFQADASNFADYPTLGVDVNALYIGANMFSAAGGWVGSNGYVVNRTQLLSGGPITVTQFSNLAAGSGSGPITPQGVDNFDPSATSGYFIGVDNAVFSLLVIRRVSNPGSATPTISGNINLTVPTTTFPSPVQHLGNSGGNNGRLDALDDRLFAAMQRGGHLWTCHNFRVSAAGVANTSTSARVGVRWYDITNLATTPTLVQSGTIFDNAATAAAARWHFIPTVMTTGQGHTAFSMTTAGANFNVNTATVGRLSGDALGTTQGSPIIITSSAAAYNPPGDPGSSGSRRWGDYSYIAVDPLDDMTMWMVNQWCNGTNTYGCQITKLKAPAPATPSSCSPASVNTGVASVNVTLTGTSVSGSGFFDPGANLPAPALPFNHIAASISGGVTVNSVTYTDPTHITLNISTVGATPGMQTITVTNPDGQVVASATGILMVTGPSCPVITVTNPGVNTGTSGVLFSQTFGASGGTTPYTFSTASALPNGMTLSPAGVLGGTPTQTGSFPIVVTATDSNNCMGMGATYTLLICPVVSVDNPGNRVYCHNAPATVNFTGAPAGNTYSWSNDNIATGLTASGSGNLSFTATNTTNAPLISSVTVTPSNGSCSGPPAVFSITVNPIPNAMASPANQSVCSGGTISTIALSGNVAGTVYNWTRDNNAGVTGIAASGSGDISGILTNTTGSAVTVTFTITPSYTNAGQTCEGQSITATVVVNPTPAAVAAMISPTGIRCSDDPLVLNVSNNVPANYWYSWSGNGLTGTGDFATNPGTTTPATTNKNIVGSFSNKTLVQQTATIKVVAIAAGGCQTDTARVTVTMNPEPVVNPISPSSQMVCNGSAMTTIVTSLDPTAINSGVARYWKRDNTANIPTAVAASGTNNVGGILNLASGVTTNQTTNFKLYAKVLTTGCTSDTVTVPVTVKFSPTTTVVKPASKTQTKDSGSFIDTINVAMSPSNIGGNITWSISGSPVGGTCLSDNTLPITGSIVNFGSTQTTVRWIFRTNLNGCFGKADTAYVYVNPPILASQSLTPYNALLEEFIGFSGSKNGSTAALTLKSANVFLNGDYLIEKSTDGIRFEPFLVVPEAMATAIRNGHTVFDEAPANGLNYYRLSQQTGSNRVFSNTVILVFGDESNTCQLFLRPNPTASNLFVTVSAPKAAEGKLVIYDAQERAVILRNVSLRVGENQETFDVSALSSGVYFVRLETTGPVTAPTVRFVKSDR